MRELEVLQKVKQYLKENGLGGRKVLETYTDPHPSLQGDKLLEPFQRFALPLDGAVVHPDLVGRLDDGETTFAIEAKGAEDYLLGLSQAGSYRLGFHLALLACAAPPGMVLSMAYQQQVGLLAFYPDKAPLLHLPEPHLPLRKPARIIQQQFATTEALQGTFTYNLPTHYLSIAAALQGQSKETYAHLEAKLRREYPSLPKDFRPVLRGAQKLGLIQLRDSSVELTLAGEAAGALLPPLTELELIHRKLSKSVSTLEQESPQTAAVLRILLAQDPIAQLLVAVLSKKPINMPKLAVEALRHNREQALIALFNPEVLDTITQQGDIVWTRVRPEHYRSTTYFQYKSLLKHAGILAAHPLGGSTSQKYQPEKDLWEINPSRYK